jgi:hypothetical protein
MPLAACVLGSAFTLLMNQPTLPPCITYWSMQNFAQSSSASFGCTMHSTSIEGSIMLLPLAVETGTTS